MSKKLGQEPVYPVYISDSHYKGLPIRLHLASLAMQGILSNPNENLLTTNLVCYSLECADELLKQYENDN